MAVIIDDKARAAIDRRRSRGLDATLVLRVEKLPRRGPYPLSDLSVRWASCDRTRRPLTLRTVGDVAVLLGRRIARYSAWHDVVVSAWRLGPIERLTVNPAVLPEMERWERTHPEVNPWSA